MNSAVARAILRALAEAWPEDADLEEVVIRDGVPPIVVTVWTASPGRVIGHRGSTASALKERLRAVVPDRAIELRVRIHAAPEREDPHSQGVVSTDGGSGRDLVPDLIGLTLREAHAKARSSGFALATGDPDGTPISYYMAHGEHGHWVVVAQSPTPGEIADLHSQIVVEIDERGGGEAGDREPRAPRPPGGIIRLERSLGIDDVDFLEDVE